MSGVTAAWTGPPAALDCRQYQYPTSQFDCGGDVLQLITSATKIRRTLVERRGNSDTAALSPCSVKRVHGPAAYDFRIRPWTDNFLVMPPERSAAPAWFLGKHA